MFIFFYIQLFLATVKAQAIINETNSQNLNSLFINGSFHEVLQFNLNEFHQFIYSGPWQMWWCGAILLLFIDFDFKASRENDFELLLWNFIGLQLNVIAIVARKC